jgi:glycosyltransferase involved in cell wall biosynthesis
MSGDLATQDQHVLPMVTIGMPVFNDDAYVGLAIESLLAQSFRDFELLISDNASTDRTGEIAEQFARRDPRVRYYRQPENIGIIPNFNFVKSLASGRFFMWAAADDVWQHQFLERAVRLLEENAGAVGAFAPFSFMDQNGNLEGQPLHVSYVGSSAVARIVQLARKYDDRVFYALWRADAIRQVELPIWWRINRWTPLNCAYPLLFAALARGAVMLCEGPVLFLKRVRTDSSRFPQMANRWMRLIRFAVHKLNVLVESVRYVHRASRSLSLTLAVLPALSVRWAVETAVPLRLFVKARMGGKST